jgi:hypothetical protein
MVTIFAVAVAAADATAVAVFVSQPAVTRFLSLALSASKVDHQPAQIRRRDYIAMYAAWYAVSVSLLSPGIPECYSVGRRPRQRQLNRRAGPAALHPEIGGAEGGWQLMQGDAPALPPSIRDSPEKFKGIAPIQV